MLSIVSALIAVSVLGLLFNATRFWGIAAVAILTLQYPVLSLAGLSLGLAIFIYIKFFK
jgi:hypothetical protein